MAKDSVFALPLARIGDFEFDDQVADVFPDMIARSVPGYGTVLSMTAELATQQVASGETVYDLGCSLGAATLLIASRVPTDCRIVAVDSSPAMVERLRKQVVAMRLDSEQHPTRLWPIEVLHQDIRDTPIQGAKLVVLNYTLQFVPLSDRLPLLRTICQGLVPGGMLVLTEKIKFSDPTMEHRITELHHAFKRAQGYSELEIAQKRTALENRLFPETIETHRERLEQSGFGIIDSWFQCLNFVSLLAIKSASRELEN